MRVALAAVLILAVAPAVAAPCTPPALVVAYLQSHRPWAMLDIGDLSSDDRTLWQQYHKGACPGMARVALDGGKENSFALALLDKNKHLAALDVIPAGAGKLREFVLDKPFAGSTVVVWRAPPGPSADILTGRKVRIANDSIIWEKMESAAQQFYFANGRFHMLQTSD